LLFKIISGLAVAVCCQSFSEIAAKTLAPFDSRAFSVIFSSGSGADRPFSFGRPVDQKSFTLAATGRSEKFPMNSPPFNGLVAQKLEIAMKWLW
jgi:hypothetical protein